MLLANPSAAVPAVPAVPPGWKINSSRCGSISIRSTSTHTPCNQTYAITAPQEPPAALKNQKICGYHRGFPFYTLQKRRLCHTPSEKHHGRLPFQSTAPRFLSQGPMKGARQMWMTIGVCCFVCINRGDPQAKPTGAVSPRGRTGMSHYPILEESSVNVVNEPRIPTPNLLDFRAPMSMTPYEKEPQSAMIYSIPLYLCCPCCCVFSERLEAVGLLAVKTVTG